MTEQEQRLLEEIRVCNETRQMGCNPMASGGKGSNFHNISIQKRLRSLEQKGLIELGAHNSWWIVKE